MKIPLDNLYCTQHSMCRTVYGTQYVTLDASIFDNLRSELRRGSLILAVLAQLRSEQYGYTLRKALADHGMEIEESTLYPLLRRLESQGLLCSEWREEDKRNKRFYVLSSDGQEVLEQLLAEWRNLDSSLSEIVGGKEHATR
jgi:PadR family transcriptional regulator